MTDDGGIAFDTTSTSGIRFRPSSLTINGVPAKEGSAWWEAVPNYLPRSYRRDARKFYGHHLPRRLRRGKK